MTRSVILNTMAAGMTRLRGKGGASPETAWEITNGYVTASKSIKQRPAVVYQTLLPATSRGLCPFNGNLYTFTANAVSNPGTATVKILRHPNPDFVGELYRIHFAAPFMGLLYVVAEFDDHNIYHYWLQEPPAWQQNHVYQANELVQPTVPNGLYYKAVLQNPPPAWQPLTQYVTGQAVQPTTYNGFEYTAQNLLPSSPTTSSDIEPVWPTAIGSFILESSSGTGTSQPPAPPVTPPATPPGKGSGGRYSNPGGSGGRFGTNPLTR